MSKNDYFCDMNKNKNSNISLDQINRMGNVAIFFAENTIELSKTKLLKLVYLAEELFVKKHASPFLGVPFNAWQLGPVQRELFTNLDVALINSTDGQNSSLLSEYITLELHPSNKYFIKKLKNFNDDEFSDDEISTLSHIANEYKYHEANHLIFITHKGSSLWYKTVIKEEGLLERFESKKQTVSDIVLDFADLIENEKIKEFYYNQLDLLEYTNSLKYA